MVCVTSRRTHTSTMAAFQLLFLLLVSCAPSSAYPPGHLSQCQIVQKDVLCSDQSLRSAPVNLPPDVQMLDLSRNQVQNLTRETLGFHTGFHRLNLHSNKIHFIQPRLFENMTDLRVLDLSRNHLNVFAHSKTNIGSLKAVESLDLSSNGLYTGMSDYFLTDSPSLANLSLNSNSITKISHNMFRGSLSLKKISLHNNVILEIEDGAFDSLHHLTELDLSKNSITCINDFDLYNLKLFNLSKNSLETFQSDSSDILFKLLSLDLSENKMLYFPDLPEKNELEYLNVSRNQLQTTNVTRNQEKQSILKLCCLKYLDMSYNQLKGIPESFFFSTPLLEVLNVSNNCIHSFSVSHMTPLNKVRVINLSYNSLQSLTFGENTLRSLKKLFLQGNKLTVLDHQIFQRLPSIRHLHLEQNNLQICPSEPKLKDHNHQVPTDCVSFSSVHNLHFLYLSENHLRTLPGNAFVDTPLKLLDLSLNPGLNLHKDSLSGLENSLVHLLLRENNISSLNTDLSSLKCLKHVDLSTNQLNSLLMWNKESSIESLNLQNNNLVTLDHHTILALERHLKTLYMGSNPLSCCDNLSIFRLVHQSAVVVPDIATATCFHEKNSEPVNIKKVTPEMCHRPDVSNYVVGVVVTLLVAMILLGLLIKCCRLRKRKHNRSFNA
ncbi:transforming growth factor beta activator LRRC32 isoform X2 [Melanotaenia boesemani]|uniref:transforming growth factor beta activator LRRC32 isoform X2 n=1 Tax=Melanotaenia boesemani TaxID=1250792 RepID=UPI001C040A0F|nr:transforming growth factor beta activator LRRC32 isoform X2 [Melanotaenia boesemani]